MNPERAKQILLLYRPGPVGDGDPEVAEALTLLEGDEELRRWFEAQRAAQDAIRRQFKNISPPAALKEQIISERPWHTRPVTARHFVAVAAVAVVLVVAGLWWIGRTPPEAKGFATYCSRMFGTVIRSYPPMQIETNNLGSIRAFLKQHGAIGDFVAPPALARTPVAGGLAMPWRGRPVTMICFKTGRPLPPLQGGDLWLFVIDSAALPDPPPNVTPQLAKLDDVAYASWTQAGKTYVLAVEGDEALLKKFL